MLAKNDDTVYLMKNESPDTQHQLGKATYDAWFKAQVQTSLDDPRPSIPNEEAKHLMAIKRQKLRKA
ncbi:hypothetical protein EAH72_31890 [Pseudomonas caspiana]|uniref:Stability determinant domain-containing protein n=2 Tax=Pseudomonas mandelii TaxID=75612 RepID=A0A502I6A7_9PSED|nr:hypothetical protein EAH74_19665 [Pseudomonas mandelii]TPG89301.1 hypothetical protein EAH72_31890 [Pseudomonas caspiana]